MKRFIWVLPILLLSGCTKQLETGLSEQDAQEIVVTLQEHGIDAVTQVEASGNNKGPATWQVEVRGTSAKVVEAWKVLRENGLPRGQEQGLEQVFANSGMIPTASEEKARLLVGISGELDKTLKSLDDVVDAHVQVVLPDNSPLLDKSQQNPTTASVLLTYRAEQPPLKEQDIKNLIAKGVEGLSPDNVSVVMKKVQDKKLPEREYGPFLASEWTVIGSLATTGVSGLVSLFLVFLSRQRKRTIKRLEHRLAERSSAPAVGNAQIAEG
jgi:type III secretion protein J